MKTHVDQNIKMSVGSASSASSAGQRSGRRTNLTVADVYDIAADIGMNFFFFFAKYLLCNFFANHFAKIWQPQFSFLKLTGS